MKKKVIISIIAVVAASLGVATVIVYAYSTMATNRTSLTLSFVFGNNNGSSIVYDTSGNGRNSTETGTVTFTDDYVEYSGTTGNYLSVPGAGIFNSANTSFAIVFNPDTSVEDDHYDVMLDGDATSRYGIHKGSSSGGYVMYVIAGGTTVESISSSTYRALWKKGEKNILIFSGTSGNTNVWLNGTQILTSDATTWTAGDPATVYVGSSYLGSSAFDGKFYSLRIWNRLLTTAEVEAISADRKDYMVTSSVKYVQSAPRNGLVGYWNMDTNDISGTTVYDKSGNDNNGTITSVTCSVAGQMNEACTFDADGDNIAVGTSASLQPANLTFAAWVKRTSSWNNQAIGLFWAKPSGVFDSTYGWHITSDDGANEDTPIVLRVSGNNYCYVSADIDTFYPLNEWVHIAATFNSGTNSCILYKNGVAVTTGNSGTPDVINSSADTKYIGLNNGYGSSMDDGLMDEVRIYNRDFSASEIKQLYDSAKINYVR